MSAFIRRPIIRSILASGRSITSRTAPVLVKQVYSRSFTSACSPQSIALRALGQQTLLKDGRFYSTDSFPTHNIIAMPALSPTMTAGALGTWQKKVGDEVVPGDVLVEIETDKAQMDFECQEEGYLAKILVETGSKDVTVGQPIAIFVEDPKDVAAFENFSAKDIESASKPEQPKEESEPKESEPKEETEKETKSAEKASSSNEADGDRVKASPIARKLASERKINLDEVKGTGSGGIITKEDIENYKASAPKATSTSAAPAPASIPTAYTPKGAAGEAYTDIPTTNMRRIIASRLSESKQQVPHYYVTVEINMDKTNKLREVLNKSSEGKYKLSVNDFVIKASALALKKVPEVNSAWQGEFIRQYNSADISVAVATPSGLITPIVTAAETKGLSTISAQVKDLATRARDGKLSPNEYQGGSFTISNLGMYGVSHFTAIINPPQACILAVGGAQQKLVPDETNEKGYSVRNVMEVTLSADHRVVDGAVGATWLQAFREYMENPLKMML
ncbi:pyruvate dehydrogenase complex dihydrolipoamide acetyltransferase [Pilobolus umbonatus]|nr:pyruvate dehydrogenase complex dihydrolipoamide acetyltransferase [Pilobolus umbonatus]